MLEEGLSSHQCLQCSKRSSPHLTGETMFQGRLRSPHRTCSVLKGTRLTLQILYGSKRDTAHITGLAVLAQGHIATHRTYSARRGAQLTSQDLQRSKRNTAHLAGLVVLEEGEQADLAPLADAAEDRDVGALSEPDGAVEDVGGRGAGEQQVHQLLGAVAVPANHRVGRHVHVLLHAERFDAFAHRRQCLATGTRDIFQRNVQEYRRAIMN